MIGFSFPGVDNPVRGLAKQKIIYNSLSNYKSKDVKKMVRSGFKIFYGFV
jgi:hypothetical protein